MSRKNKLTAKEGLLLEATSYLAMPNTTTTTYCYACTASRPVEMFPASSLAAVQISSTRRVIEEELGKKNMVGQQQALEGGK